MLPFFLPLGQIVVIVYASFFRIPITISFVARHEQEYNFYLKCKIKCKPDPLLLTIKATGYSINTTLTYTAPDETTFSLPTGKTDTRSINFGSLPVNERALGQISVFNNGQYNIEYKWLLSSKCKTKSGMDLVTLSPLEGTVVPQDKASCEIIFSPPSKMSLKGCEIQLQVSNYIHVIEYEKRAYFMVNLIL